MDKYYYFVSQLPLLLFGREASLVIDDFLREAKKWLGARDYVILSRGALDDISPTAQNPAGLKEYVKFESRLRNDIARWRKARQAGQKYMPVSFPPSFVEEGTPLEVEKKLMRLRWVFIEHLEAAHHFDLEFLILYFLKLQILHRLFSFEKEKGSTKFNDLCEVAP